MGHHDAIANLHRDSAVAELADWIILPATTT